jgi:hypothetical protein
MWAKRLLAKLERLLAWAAFDDGTRHDPHVIERYERAESYLAARVDDRAEYLCRFPDKGQAEGFADWCERTGRPVYRVTCVGTGPGEWWIEYGPPTRPSVS